jgi:hypothetical protein
MTKNSIITQCKPDFSLAERFLKYLDPNATVFTFQTLDDNQDRADKSLIRTLHGSLADNWNAMASLSQKGAGIFVTVNETDLKGRKDENIKRIRAVFVDTDGAPQAPIDAYSPHIIVETSPGRYHNYWLVDRCPLSDFKTAQLQMIRVWGTDKSINDLSRIMRLPGFPHQKVKMKKGLTGSQFLVKIVNSPEEIIFPDTWEDRKQIINQLAQLPSKPAAQSARKLNTSTTFKDWNLGQLPAHVAPKSEGNMFTAEKMRHAQECLPYIDPRPRENWFSVTTILASEFGDSGRQLAHKWACGELWFGKEK